MIQFFYSCSAQMWYSCSSLLVWFSCKIWFITWESDSMIIEFFMNKIVSVRSVCSVKILVVLEQHSCWVICFSICFAACFVVDFSACFLTWWVFIAFSLASFSSSSFRIFESSHLWCSSDYIIWSVCIELSFLNWIIVYQNKCEQQFFLQNFKCFFTNFIKYKSNFFSDQSEQWSDNLTVFLNELMIKIAEF